MRRASLRPARLDDRKKVKPQFQDAVKTLASAIPQGTSFFVGITAIAYFCGWREASAYYTTLGAPWMISNLPSFAFLSLSGPMMITIAIAAFLSMEQVAFLGGTGKGIGRVALGFVLLGILTPQFAEMFAERFTEQGIWTLHRISAYLTYFSAGLFVGQAAAEMRNSNLKWSRSVINPIYFLVYYGLFQAPTTLGNAHGHYDLLPSSTELSVVPMKDENGSPNWRLVNVIGTSALILKPSTVKDGHVLRLIETKEIPAIWAPGRK
jgi:hypothetical protein